MIVVADGICRMFFHVHSLSSMRCDAIRWDTMGYDSARWDTMGWDRMGYEAMRVDTRLCKYM